MAYNPNKELDPECLQVLALAAIQVIGEDALVRKRMMTDWGWMKNFFNL